MNYKIEQKFMGLALEEARKAKLINEVPVGAVLLGKDNSILSKAHNLRESTNDSTAHAEILAIREASVKLGSWRLLDTTLYVTLEPCVMCIGAIINSRIKRVVFGARDEKAGALLSVYKIGLSDYLNHKIEFTEGVLGSECRGILKEFFKGLRGG